MKETIRFIFKQAFSLPLWIFVRLPLGFSIPFAIMTILWMFYGYRTTKDLIALKILHVLTFPLELKILHVLTFPLERFFHGIIRDPFLNNLYEFLLTMILMFILVLGFLIAYNLSVLLNIILNSLEWKPRHFPNGPPGSISRFSSCSDEFANVNRIGIVLAGGGAKGAFQAGAMKAIYHYLEEKGVLEKVKVISGTSIGSWNALFWLADLIKSGNGWQDKGIHERWWGLISAKSLAAPSWYIPFLRNAFLSSAPWQQVFNHIFVKKQEVSDRISQSKVSFFLTRSNVRTGELECATNNPNPVPISGVKYEILNPAGDRRIFMEGLKAAVFASMDLPPLFPYFKRNGKLFEDGGVIDNLPIVVASVHQCDLLFILSLNSDFEEKPNLTSVLARMRRVMDVRQGVLERNGLKMIYLFDELAALRKDDQSFRQKLNLPLTLPGESPLARALRRSNERLNVFAICPQKNFVKNTIETQEFWKSKEATRVFSMMCEATKKELEKFRFDQKKDMVRVALVSESGKITWDDDF